MNPEANRAFFTVTFLFLLLFLFFAINSNDQISIVYKDVTLAALLGLVFLKLFFPERVDFIGEPGKAILSAGLGLLLGLIFTYKFFAGQPFAIANFSLTLSVPVSLAVAQGSTVLVYLLSVGAAFAEEIFFRGFLFNLMQRVAKSRLLFIGTSGLIALTILSFGLSDYILIGGFFGLLAVYVWLTRKTLLNTLNMQLIFAAATTSVAFGLFHLNAYKGDITLVVSAIIFSLIAIFIYKATGSVIGSIIAHTMNNGIIIGTSLGLGATFGLLLAFGVAAILIMISTNKLSLHGLNLKLPSIG